MVGVGHVCMRMAQRLVSMHMAVRSGRHVFVAVKMVPVFMRMGMLMLQHLMPMLVTM